MEFPPALQQVIAEAWSLPHQIQHVGLGHCCQEFIAPRLKLLIGKRTKLGLKAGGYVALKFDNPRSQPSHRRVLLCIASSSAPTR
jgi:hypothetical protein